MTDDQQADIKARTAAVAGLVATLQAALLMIGVYEDVGGMDSEIDGARQTACAALANIESNLAALKEYCA